MNHKDFKHSFTAAKSAPEVFDHLLEPKNWWTGLFDEKIEGKSKELNDEFSFSAGNGVHYSNQKLTTLQPGKKIEWLVTESRLSFLKAPGEWEGTKISFEIEPAGSKTKVTFQHTGLEPEIECYDSCTGAWTQYLQNLQAVLS